MCTDFHLFKDTFLILNSFAYKIVFKMLCIMYGVSIKVVLNKLMNERFHGLTQDLNFLDSVYSDTYL